MLLTGKLLYTAVLLMLAVNTGVANTQNASIAADKKQQVIEIHRKVITQLVQSADVQQCLDREQHKADSLQTILQIDQKWPTQVQYVHRVIEHPCAKLFKQYIQDPVYHFSEIMLTDDSGALVAAYPRPSDYWQGDEQKFIQPAATSKKYISHEDWDASTGTFSFFISVPVFYSQHFAGVLITGINVTTEYLDQLSMQELLIIDVKPEDESNIKPDQ
ncbi:hypothetical protein [Neptunicella sp. SCSIO 80796]|uniref:hypothetical protein n=1 Tax=Neptunicella plasticusilytica TaxID=3117012 RepID=UPI003A4E53D1